MVLSGRSWVLISQAARTAPSIGTWAVPTLGGEPRPYLQGVAGSLTGHATVHDSPTTPTARETRCSCQTKAACDWGINPSSPRPPRLHGHFPLWSARYGSSSISSRASCRTSWDIWRIRPTGGLPERITSHMGYGRVIQSCWIAGRLFTSLKIRMVPDRHFTAWTSNAAFHHRSQLTASTGKYTSLAASAPMVAVAGRNLRKPQENTLAHANRRTAERNIRSNTNLADHKHRVLPATGFRFSSIRFDRRQPAEHLEALSNGTDTELWRADGGENFIGGPAISHDGQYVAFSVRQHGKSLLYLMKVDGTNARIVTDSLNLQGTPAWAPDGTTITTATEDHDIPHLVHACRSTAVPLSPLIRDYSIDPAWAADGCFVVYSGADIGTTFSMKAITGRATPHSLPPLTLTRGARHVAFLPGGQSLVLLRGDIQHKDLWSIDLKTGTERQLTKLPPEFEVGDFDVSPDGHEEVLERVQQRSDVVMLDLPRP